MKRLVLILAPLFIAVPVLAGGPILKDPPGLERKPKVRVIEELGGSHNAHVKAKLRDDTLREWKRRDAARWTWMLPALPWRR
jgi:hypothetical protein